jgi:hypothetical protein
MPQKQLLQVDLAKTLGGDFTLFLEAPSTPNEHLHVQRRFGTTFTIEEYLIA